MNATLILFLTHRWSPLLGERFLRLHREARAFGDIRLLLHDDHGPVRAAWLDLLDRAGIPDAVEFFDPHSLEAELGYPLLRAGSLTPGSAHYPLMRLARNTHYQWYWLIEFDVECARPWHEFFADFGHCEADLLASHVQSRAQQPDWYWWDALRDPRGSAADAAVQWKAFFPAYRISQRALAAVDAAHQAGWCGHCEAIVPSVLKAGGFEVRDLREFSDCYSGTEQDPHEDASMLSSMRYRPEITLQELAVRTPTPRLLHPVKSGVSVVMATRNGARFIGEQLDSLEQQTRKPDELIIVDDCSSDRTRDLLRNFAGRSKLNVRLFEQEKRVGYSANFLGGLSLTVGDLILFCDQDDLWQPEKIEVIERFAANSDKTLFSHDIEILPSPRMPAIGSFFGHLDALGFGPYACIKGHTLALRRAFLLQWGPPPAQFSYDLWFALLATMADQRAYIPEVLVRHRLHDANASGWIPGHKDLCALTPDALRAGLPPGEVLLDLCIKDHVEKRLAALEQVLRSRLEATRSATLKKAMESITRHRGRMFSGRDSASTPSVSNEPS